MNYNLYAIRIFVEDWESAVDFYEKKMEMKLAFRNDEMGWAQVEIGENVYLGLERVDASSSEFADLVGRFVGVSLQVENIQETYRSLKAKGVQFIGEPEKQGWGGTLAHFKDNDGNILTLLGSD